MQDYQRRPQRVAKAGVWGFILALLAMIGFVVASNANVASATTTPTVSQDGDVECDDTSVSFTVNNPTEGPVTVSISVTPVGGEGNSSLVSYPPGSTSFVFPLPENPTQVAFSFEGQVLLSGTYEFEACAPPPVDTDGDGVPDDQDECPGTTPGTEVDEDGCEVVVDPGTSTLPLHNDSAQTGSDCPDDEHDYWHFVLTPNNGGGAFVSISLNLGSATVTFSGSAIIPNGSQLDNVFVRVPDGYEVEDLQAGGSSAEVSGDVDKFVLSHVCNGGGSSTTTTTTVPSGSTTTTTVPSGSTTTTTVPSGSTTTVPQAAVTTTTVKKTVPPKVVPVAPNTAGEDDNARNAAIGATFMALAGLSFLAKRRLMRG